MMPSSDGEVVLDDVELGDRGRALGRREDHAIGVRHAQLAPARLDHRHLGGGHLVARRSYVEEDVPITVADLDGSAIGWTVVGARRRSGHRARSSC